MYLCPMYKERLSDFHYSKTSNIFAVHLRETVRRSMSDRSLVIRYSNVIPTKEPISLEALEALEAPPLELCAGSDSQRKVL